MNKRSFQIVADVYRLLGDHDARAIAEAAKQQSLSENLQTALAALAREAVHSHERARRGTQGKEPVIAIDGKTQTGLSPRVSRDAYRENLVTLLMNTKRFPDKRSLESFAKRVGVQIQSDAKVSRQRIAGRIARRVSEDAGLRESLKDWMAPGRGDDQTEGWLDLILNKK